MVRRDKGSGLKGIEEELGKSEERYRDLFENTGDVILMMDSKGYVTSVNQTVGEYGFKRSDLVGKNFLGYVSKKYRPKMLREHAKVTHGGAARGEIEVITPKGNKAVEYRAIPTRRKNKIIGYQAILRDITEHKKAEDFLRAQRDLAVALSGTSGLKEGLRLCIGAAVRISGMDCGGVYLVDEGTGTLDLILHKGLPPGFVKSVSHYNTDSANAKIVMGGKTVYSQFKKLGVKLDKSQRDEGLRAIAVIPILHEGMMIGCLNMASHALGKVPATSRIVLEAIAAQIGCGIARLKAEEALRRYQEPVSK
jgi:PAS domain S-box-containing protein